MTYPLTYTQPISTTERRVGVRARLQAARADRAERVRVRRTALAVSEEARINAQMRYRRVRYRHMAN